MCRAAGGPAGDQDQADAVASGVVPVLRAGRSARPGPGELRCSGRGPGCGVDVTKPPPDSVGCKSLWCSGFLPWMSQVGRQGPCQTQLGVSRQDQPGPAVGRIRVPQLGVQPRVCLNRWNVCSISKRRKNIRQQRSMSSLVAATLDHHSHTGLLTSPLGTCSTNNRITVPSMIGIGPSYSTHAEPRCNLGYCRSHASAVALP